MKVEMKDSGIPWIGEIPKDWEIRKVKLLYRVFNGSTPKSDNTDFWDGEIKWITPVDMYNNQEIYASIKTITELGYKSCGTTIIPENSIILSTRAPIGQVSMNKVALCTNQGCKSLVLKNESYTKYHFYYFQVQTAVLNMLGRGTTFLELSTTDLNNYLLPVPPFQLQQQIANFLDEKCDDIDQLITLQHQMIDELKAYKQSVITEAVCKGLDKSVPMKDSGIEWIGEVPEGWKITKLKNVSKLKTGGTPNGYDNQSDFTTRKPWFTPSDFNENYKLIQSNRFLNLEVIENEKIILFPKHTVLMVCIGTVGKVGILTEEGYCNQQVTAIIPNGRMLPEYILYTLIAENKIIRDLANYTILPIINNSFLKEIILVCPTFEEQKNIVAFIEHKSSQIDTLISIKQQKINELKEYKKSMIYEYITGKKQVPNE